MRCTRICLVSFFLFFPFSSLLPFTCLTVTLRLFSCLFTTVCLASHSCIRIPRWSLSLSLSLARFTAALLLPSQAISQDPSHSSHEQIASALLSDIILYDIYLFTCLSSSLASFASSSSSSFSSFPLPLLIRSSLQVFFICSFPTHTHKCLRRTRISNTVKVDELFSSRLSPSLKVHTIN